MIRDEFELGQRSAISASWKRCKLKHRLARDTTHPILRLQASEVRPRSEELVERAGGRLGIFRQVADVAVRAGHCFSIADADGILVRREGKAAEQSDYESNGIALGSCWDERLAGTNGVSMALDHDRPFTVRGNEHFFSRFTPFACTGATLRDAVNEKIGVVNLAIVDRRNAADYRFAEQLLGAAAARIQRVLFERRFSDKMLVTISQKSIADALCGGELVAVDESGLILGSTTAAHRLIGLAGPMDLIGQSFEDVFGIDTPALDRAPEHAPYLRSANGSLVRLSRQPKTTKPYLGQRLPAPEGQSSPGPGAVSIQQLSSGSATIADLCARAQEYLARRLPFIVQGASGSGKTSLVKALHGNAERAPRKAIIVDCSVLRPNERGRAEIEAIFDQARLVGLRGSVDPRPTSLIFDNVHEMPGFAQGLLRVFLQEQETVREAVGTLAESTSIAVIATTRVPLVQEVRAGRFREDLYYLLANTIIALPRLQLHEALDVLTNSLAARIAGRSVEIAPEAMAAIRSHSWPGNVRELRSALQQAILGGDGRRISLMDLKTSTMFDQGVLLAAAHQSLRDVPYSERNEILDALIGASWNVSQAARRLGIGRATIHRKMNKYNISRPS